jgi:hypothetical protein
LPDAATPPAQDDAGAPEDSGPKPPQSCPDGRKACGDTCVSLDDPRTGCAAPSCAPCAIPHGTGNGSGRKRARH